MQELPFGRFSIPNSQVFAVTEQSYAFVNLKPIVPGMLLIAQSAATSRHGHTLPASVEARLSRCNYSWHFFWLQAEQGFDVPVHTRQWI